MLFTSDSDLRQQQRESARAASYRGMVLSDEERRRESMEADRELREHQRWREFAWLLFIAPILIALLTALAQWAVLKFMMPTP